MGISADCDVISDPRKRLHEQLTFGLGKNLASDYVDEVRQINIALSDDIFDLETWKGFPFNVPMRRSTNLGGINIKLGLNYEYSRNWNKFILFIQQPTGFETSSHLQG